MKLAVVVAAGALAMTPVGALADSATHTYLLVAEAANVGVAANGETIEITCARRTGHPEGFRAEWPQRAI